MSWAGIWTPSWSQILASMFLICIISTFSSIFGLRGPPGPARAAGPAAGHHLLLHLLDHGP
jgi:hypothetical protein